MTVTETPEITITEQELLSLYEQMEVIRRTEKAAHDLFLAGLVKGTTHLAAGHEAVAVGASAALRPGTTSSPPAAATTTPSPAAPLRPSAWPS
jgi:TPP-dependent pyruvate/acetoin dehydrogenase alpha subunit